jgi:hypothetical protein
MKARRIIRASRKTSDERARERKLRDKLQKEKPSFDDFICSGVCDPDSVRTMGMYYDVQTALQALKHEREQAGLTVGEVAERSGLDRAVVSRLENGRQDNPTVATLMRYAAAICKRFLWNYEDLVVRAASRDTSARRRRG